MSYLCHVYLIMRSVNWGGLGGGGGGGGGEEEDPTAAAKDADIST